MHPWIIHRYGNGLLSWSQAREAVTFVDGDFTRRDWYDRRESYRMHQDAGGPLRGREITTLGAWAR